MRKDSGNAQLVAAEVQVCSRLSWPIASGTALSLLRSPGCSWLSWPIASGNALSWLPRGQALQLAQLADRLGQRAQWLC